MKTRTFRARNWNCAAVLTFIALGTGSASAQLYWDANGAAPGAGATPTGTWGTDAFWSTDPGGEVATAGWAGTVALFSAGTDATGPFTLNVSGTQSVSSVTFQEGQITLASGTIGLGATGVGVISSGASVSIASSARFSGSVGAKITLDGGTLIQTNPSNGLSFLPATVNLEIGAAGGTVNYTSSGAGTSTIYGTSASTPAGQVPTIVGTGVLTKTGPNEFRYQGLGLPNTTYSKLVVNQGTFRLGFSNSIEDERGFGAVPGSFTPDAITLNGGAIATSFNAANSVLHANRGITLGPSGGTISSVLTVPGAVTGSGALTLSAAVNLNGLNTFTGGITVTTGTSNVGASGGIVAQTIAGAGSLTVNGVVSGGTLTKNNTATLTLNGANTHTGQTLVNAGILNVGSADALGTPSANTEVASGAELRIDGATKTFTLNEPLSIAGPGAGGGGAITIQNASAPTIAGPITLTADATVTVSSTATGTFTNPSAFTSQSNQSLTLQGGSGAGGGATITGAVNLGGGGLTKLQGGRWTIGGGATYSGATTIGAGTLQVTSAITGTSGVSIAGTLAGNGSVTLASGGDVTFGATGKLSPGTSAGTLTINLAGDGLLDATGGIGGSSTGAFVFELDTPITSDLLVVTGGAIEIGAGLLQFDDFTFTALAGFGEGDYLLFDGSAPISGTLGANTSGTINGLTADLQVSGGDLVLHVVPEPASAVMLIGGLAVLMARRKRR